jgi:hypothetical protein
MTHFLWFVWNRKTTLSEIKKKLIGDDEHGWTSETPFLILKADATAN